MKDNRYTRALSSVAVGEETLEKGLRYARENSKQSREDNVM